MNLAFHKRKCGKCFKNIYKWNQILQTLQAVVMAVKLWHQMFCVDMLSHTELKSLIGCIIFSNKQETILMRAWNTFVTLQVWIFIFGLSNSKVYGTFLVERIVTGIVYLEMLQNFLIPQMKNDAPQGNLLSRHIEKPEEWPLQSPCLSIYLSICTHETTREPLNRFSWNLILEKPIKFVDTFQFWLNLGKNNWHFAWWPMFISVCISSPSH
jgi:hypothetical protein